MLHGFTIGSSSSSTNSKKIDSNRFSGLQTHTSSDEPVFGIPCIICRYFKNVDQNYVHYALSDGSKIGLTGTRHKISTKKKLGPLGNYSVNLN